MALFERFVRAPRLSFTSGRRRNPNRYPNDHPPAKKVNFILRIYKLFRDSLSIGAVWHHLKTKKQEALLDARYSYVWFALSYPLIFYNVYNFILLALTNFYFFSETMFVHCLKIKIC